MSDYLLIVVSQLETGAERWKKAQVFDLKSKKFFAQEYDFGGISQLDLTVFLELSKLSAP